VLEAEPQVSFTELSRVQQQVAEVIKKDPAVLGVVAVAGVGALNTTPNVASLKITLKPRDERAELAGKIIKRLTGAANSVPGVTVYFQSVPDVQIATRTSRAQYQYTLVSTDAACSMRAWRTH
jgi:multidrug efflux pump